MTNLSPLGLNKWIISDQFWCYTQEMFVFFCFANVLLIINLTNQQILLIIGKIRQQHKRRIYQIMEKIFGWLLHILEMPMGRYQRITQPTTKPTPQNKIYYGTQLKRTTIFRHLYKKRKWPNYHRYLLQTNRHPIIPPLQKPPP